MMWSTEELEEKLKLAQAERQKLIEEQERQAQIQKLLELQADNEFRKNWSARKRKNRGRARSRQDRTTRLQMNLIWKT